MSDEILKNVKIVISDVDGVWTDGGMYYGSTDIELKRFCIYDGGAVLLLKLAEIPLVILSGESNAILENRFNKLKIKDFRLGIKNKLNELSKILEDYSIKRENVLYIGDFINDYPIMKSVGIPVCPLNACPEIKSISKLIIEKYGGQGVVWELVVKVLKAKKVYEQAFDNYLKSLSL